VREVSCRALDPFLRAADKAGVPRSRLAEGVGYPLRHLTDVHEYIEWDAFRAFMANARRQWNDEALTRIGSDGLKEGAGFRAFALIGRTLASPSGFYRWLLSSGGMGNQMFSNMLPTFRELGAGRFTLDLILSPGYEPCPEFFRFAAGGFQAIPELLGLEQARVTLHEVERGAHFEIEFQDKPSLRGKLAKLITRNSDARHTATELNDTLRALEVRYAELQEARNQLELQHALVETAYRFGQRIWTEREPDSTARAVVEGLVDIAGFSRAMLEAASADRPEAVERAVAGRDTSNPAPLDVDLSQRGSLIGTLFAQPREGADVQAAKKLLDLVRPTIVLALENAFAYRALNNYQKNLEGLVEERTGELRLARDSLAQTVTALEHALVARERLFANINHEIRTPLAIIKAASAELKREADAPSQPRTEACAESIDLATNRLLRMVNELLDLAAGQAGRLQLQRSRFDLARHLRLVVSAWARVAEPEKIEISFESPESKLVNLDQEKIDRCVANLLANAIKFTPSGGAINVRLECAGDRVKVVVRDSGRGLDHEFLKRVFGRFEKGQTPLRGGSGTGIGLSLVKEVVELHGGSVTAANADNGGARFEIELPDGTSGISLTDELPASPLQAVDPHTYSLGITAEPLVAILQPEHATPGTILLAEDDPVLLESLGRFLSSKYRVILARDGREALELAKRYLPDLLVSDIDMPHLDGIQLLREFQNIPEMQMPAAIFLTALSRLSERLIGLEAGAIDYVAKPFEPVEVMARVESQLALRRRALEAAHRESLSSLGTMVKGLMHELRNPANGIVQSMQLVRGLLPAEVIAKGTAVDELLEVAEECSSQIESMCVDLLGANTQGDPICRAVPFERIVHRALALVSGFVRGVNFICEPTYTGPVWCSEHLMAQVLANLIKNGAQAAGKGGWVRLVSRADERRLMVEVGDSGAGVPPQLRQRVFEMFFTNKQPGEGSGLGLPLSRQIVERHGGLLEVRDAPSGSVFFLSLPLREQDSPRASRVKHARP
jgi:signal transduction histidine kinase